MKRTAVKRTPLKIIQIAWVAETVVILIFTMVIVIVLTAEKINLWLQFIPIFAILIGAQGTAASGGPLLSDMIKKSKEQ